ncbi:FxsA family protein [Tomitella fengzijianii]|uniref:FxsA family protein n=1 Tax=Tomitella fengzijianii TaxID=2597660 RepID=UPI00131E6670|nr:FxsA family protein [Tomitella fengzijianii]
MFRLLFLVYLVVEIAAVWAVTAWIGFGWAILLVMSGTAAGVIALSVKTRRWAESVSQARTAQDRARADGPRKPMQALADGSLTATGIGMLMVPGLVTSVAGLLFLFPPTRRVLSPAVVALGLRRFPVIGVVAARSTRTGGAPVVDGEVIDDDGRAGTSADSSTATDYGTIFPQVLPPSSGGRTR